MLMMILSEGSIFSVLLHTMVNLCASMGYSINPTVVEPSGWREEGVEGVGDSYEALRVHWIRALWSLGVQSQVIGTVRCGGSMRSAQNSSHSC